MITKKEARQIVSIERKKMSEANCMELSKSIFDRLITLDEFKKSRLLFIYSAIRNEVNTGLLLKYAFDNNIKVAFPKVIGSDMFFYEITSRNDLKKGYMGILEPVEDLPECIPDIGTIIVPGNAFDRKCHRTGYGKGFYDRYLEKYPNLIKIGLAFDYQLFDELEMDSYDIPMDYVITENLIIKRELI